MIICCYVVSWFIIVYVKYTFIDYNVIWSTLQFTNWSRLLNAWFYKLLISAHINLLKSIVHDIRFITNKKYAIACVKEIYMIRISYQYINFN